MLNIFRKVLKCFRKACYRLSQVRDALSVTPTVWCLTPHYHCVWYTIEMAVQVTPCF